MAEPTWVDTGTEMRDHRHVSAWCEWLNALAVDAEAALAAAIAYRELDQEGRDCWLLALEQDTRRLNVPRIAVYAPLLAVESDPVRRERIEDAMGPTDDAARPSNGPWALTGRGKGGVSLSVVVHPLYLSFAQVLVCAHRPHAGFDWVRHDPIVALDRAPKAGGVLEGVTLESIPLRSVVDELAHAVVAHARTRRELPEPLHLFAHLFQ
ncbi:MAG TPA: hypothetical protein VF989_11660, partial [Polyangiaceae bacterium]